MLGAHLTSDVRAADAPELTGTASRNTGIIAGRERSFLLYVPKNLQPRAPLLIVFHGGGQDGGDIRVTTGYGFDKLADEHGFVVAYPDGIEHAWSTCRRSGPRGARPANVDDLAFVDAIIAHQAAVNGIDEKRVFVTGHSNGGAMVYRLALERPEEVAGIAAISSSLPTESNLGCAAKRIPVPVLIMNGTADPVNPYRGGASNRRTAVAADPIGARIGFMGGGSTGLMESYRGSSISLGGTGRGPVMSTEATARYWAKVNGQTDEPERVKLPHLNASDPTSVEVESWTEAGKPPVVLYTIEGGGHLVPQPFFRYPGIVGKQTEDIDAPAAVWDFFSKLPGRP